MRKPLIILNHVQLVKRLLYDKNPLFYALGPTVGLNFIRGIGRSRLFRPDRSGQFRVQLRLSCRLGDFAPMQCTTHRHRSRVNRQSGRRSCNPRPQSSRQKSGGFILSGHRTCDDIQSLQIGTDLIRLCARSAVEVGLPYVHKLSVLEKGRRAVEWPRTVTRTKPHDAHEDENSNRSCSPPALPSEVLRPFQSADAQSRKEWINGIHWHDVLGSSSTSWSAHAISLSQVNTYSCRTVFASRMPG